MELSMELTAKEKINLTQAIRKSPAGIRAISQFHRYVNQKKSVALLEFLVDQIQLHLSATDTKNSNYFRKLLFSFFSYCSYCEFYRIELSSSLLQKIETLFQQVDQIADRFEGDRDIVLRTFEIGRPLLSKLAVKKEVVEDEASKEKRALLEQIVSLEQKMKLLNDQICQRERALQKRDAKIETLMNTVDKLKSQIKTLNFDFGSLQKDNEVKQQRIQTVENNFKNNQSNIAFLNRKIQFLNQELESSYQKMDELQDVNKNMEAEIQKYQIYFHKQASEKKQIQIENLMIQVMFKHPVSVHELGTILKKAGYSLSDLEVYQMIQGLNKRIAISNQTDCIPPTYKIAMEPFSLKKTVMLHVDFSKPLDFFLYSDLHYKDPFLENIASSIDLVNQYCVDSNISYTFHLGDLVSFRNLHFAPKWKEFKKIESNLPEFLGKFPVCSDIYYGFLGGNHDEQFFMYGIDPVKMLTDMSENFIHLGYGYVVICLGNELNQIMFHHPYERIPIDSETRNPGCYLEKFYKKIGKSREDVIYNYLGHTHQLYFNHDEQYCLVPSLMKDRFQNGALHVRVYFGSNQTVDHIEMIPLVVEDKLIPTEPVEYKRVKHL